MPAQAPATDSPGGRFRLFDSIATFLKKSAAGRPLVLIAEDLHWADRPSLLLLQFLAQHLQDCTLLLVATYRDVGADASPALASILGDVARHPWSRSIRLQGFTEADVRRFIELTVGEQAAGSLGTRVHQLTEGNPFFVGEIVRLLVAGECGSGAAPDIAVPPTVHDVLSRRLARLSAECQRVLGIASVIGREFDLHLLHHASGLPLERVLRLIGGAAATAGVVSAAPDGTPRFRFRHALVREAIYAHVPEADRARSHCRVGEALERVHGADLEPHLASWLTIFCARRPTQPCREASTTAPARRSAPRPCWRMRTPLPIANARCGRPRAGVPPIPPCSVGFCSTSDGRR